MDKVKSFAYIVKKAKELKKEGKTIGLVTGCFDVLHFGHVQMLKFAKTKCDVLIVGIDNDQTIKISKGSDRPIHNWKMRSSVLAELISIDYVYKIKKVINFDSQGSSIHYQKMTAKLKPNFLITHSTADRFWKEKKRRAKSINAKLFLFKQKLRTSSTEIIEKIRKES